MALVYPMFALVVWTAIVGLMTAYVRMTSAFSGRVDPRYFKLMSQYDAPDQVIKFGRNFDNLFEVPVLFYAACLCALIVPVMNGTLLFLAWSFVGLRIVHSAIHLTYNQPMHRFVPFSLSLICVLGMWLDIVWILSE